MPLFNYIAIDVRGTEQAGTLESSDAGRAAATLRARGLFPTELRAAAPGGTAATAGSRKEVAAAPPGSVPRRARFWPLARATGPRELAVFTRQLATLLRAGMPLLRGLEVLARQEPNRGFRQVLENLADGIKSGGTLSDALARHPRQFDRLYVNMVRAGEAGGVLDVVLERLARFMEKSVQLKGKVKAALVYPAIVLAVATAILAGLLVFVVPKFKQIFADLLKGAPLPPLTQLVLTVSDAVKTHCGLVGVLAVVAWLGLRLLARTTRGARLLDTGVIRLPIFGVLMLKGLVARFGRTFGTLLASGVPILRALLITRDTCENARVALAITEVHDRVKEGASVARPLEATRVFPPLVASMIEVGEQTGQLPEMLGKVADIYEDEVDNAVAGLSSMIEPVLIVFLAVVVGTIVIALFLPIVRIVQLLT